jgi:hypothetical protein
VAFFAHVVFSQRLTDIYVPFVDGTEAVNGMGKWASDIPETAIIFSE